MTCTQMMYPIKKSSCTPNESYSDSYKPHLKIKIWQPWSSYSYRTEKIEWLDAFIFQRLHVITLYCANEFAYIFFFFSFKHDDYYSSYWLLGEKTSVTTCLVWLDTASFSFYLRINYQYITLLFMHRWLLQWRKK